MHRWTPCFPFFWLHVSHFLSQSDVPTGFSKLAQKEATVLQTLCSKVQELDEQGQVLANKERKEHAGSSCFFIGGAF